MKNKFISIIQLIFMLSCKSIAQSPEQIETKAKEKGYVSTLGEFYSGAFEKLNEKNRTEVLKLDSIWSSKYYILLEDSKKERFRMMPWKREKLAKEMEDIERSIEAYLLTAKYSKPKDEQ